MKGCPSTWHPVTIIFVAYCHLFFQHGGAANVEFQPGRLKIMADAGGETIHASALFDQELTAQGVAQTRVCFQRRAGCQILYFKLLKALKREIDPAKHVAGMPTDFRASFA